MIKQKVTIKIKDSVESGVSKAKGNPWQCQSVVLEFKDLDGYTHTIATKTFKEDVIKALADINEGDEVNVGLGYTATCRTWTGKDGKENTNRGTDIILLSIENVSTF